MGTKTAKFIEIVRARGIEPRTVFEVGAFDGAQTLELAEAFSQADLYAFEPDPRNLAVVARRVNGLHRIRLIGAAVGMTSGLVLFNQMLGPNLELGSVLVPNEAFADAQKYRALPVPMLALDQFGYLVHGPAVLWMDAEGAEPDVIRGARWLRDQLDVVWSEVAYERYFHQQMLAREFDVLMGELGFVKTFEQRNNEWHGDACYVRQ